MSDAISVLLAVPAAMLIAIVALPNSWVNTRARASRVAAFRQIVTAVAGLQFIVAASFFVAFITGSVDVIQSVLVRIPAAIPIEVTIYYDGVASLMFTLVSFVGWVICRYSIRYLDGEATQGRYFRWTAFTIGSVSLMVISGNLVLFVTTWIMTSLGLHQLLLHYGHRAAARRSAWTKFAISRLGDSALLLAMAILFYEFNTLDFVALFKAAGSIASAPWSVQLASFLLVAGAITKSVQFPFHTWLPQTMETPTPVSALMHAGIVNAGGYLMIRTSPLVNLAPSALTMLAIVGGFTACFAAVVMLTQTSIKKSLAYSTIAQMGFMLFQCGLGAYSAAMLHILAHSLYKAYAFLSSGSVIAERSMSETPTENRPVSMLHLAIVGAIMIACLSLALTVFGIDPITKPGGLLLGGVLCLGLTYWIGQAARNGDEALVMRSLALSAVLCVVYAASYSMVDKLVAKSVPIASAPTMLWLVVAIVSAGFAGMFMLQKMLTRHQPSAALNGWYVHAANGFYVENTLRRIFGSLLGT